MNRRGFLQRIAACFASKASAMPTFPVTVERIGVGAFGNYPHQVFGEYVYGGTRYLVVHEPSVSGLISVYKRDPADGTWSILDAAGAPRNAYFAGSVIINTTEFGVARSGNKLWVLFGLLVPGYPPDVLAEMAVWGFDLESGEWDAAPIRSGPNMTMAEGYRPLAVPVFRSTGELAVLYNSSRSPERCSIVRLDVGAGTWSAPAALPVPEAYDHCAISVAVDASDNIHCLYSEEGGSFLHAIYSAANAFGDAIDVTAQAYWTGPSVPRYVSNLVYFSEGGVNKVGFVHLEYVLDDDTVDLYYAEGTEGDPWTWADTLIVDGTDFWAENPETYPGQFCSFSVFGGVKYAFWVQMDPHDVSYAITDFLIWLVGVQNSGSGWSVPAEATQKIAKSSTGAAKPHPTGCQTYSLDGRFSLLMAIGVATEDGYPEVWTYSIPASANFAYFGSPSFGISKSTQGHGWFT